MSLAGGFQRIDPAVGLDPMHFTVRQQYLPMSVRMDEDASEGWIFLDYETDGRVVVLARDQHEAIYRPDPEDQG